MIGIIAAFAHNRVIGNNGIIPWNIPGEQTLFRELTTGNIVVIGRRTYDEIGRPLPNRITIVISKSREYSGGNLYTVGTLDEAVKLASDIAPDKDIYLSGGSSVYKEGLELADVLYLTEIDLDVEGDTFFPEICEENYKYERIR